MTVDSNLVAKAAQALQAAHWDGTGCGTHGVNACSNCFGPSPMSAYEVAEMVAEVLASETWKPGDACASCGSLDTGWNPVEGGFCRSCGRSDADE